MILTVPNFVSTVRIALIPVFLWLLLGRDDPTAAAFLIGGIGVTDWVDGYLARRLGQISDVGKILDPLADRLAVVAAVAAGWISGALPWAIALAIATRDAVMALAALALFLRFRATLSVRYVGKLATFLVYMAIPSFFLHAGTAVEFWRWLGWVLVAPGLVLYYAAVVLYLGDIRRLFTPVSSEGDPEPGDQG